MSRVLQAIDGHATASPERIALSTKSRTWTYAQLNEEVRRTAMALFALAPMTRPGAPVALVVPNGPAWVILDLALLGLGWPSLPLPTFFTAGQREHAMADAGATLLIEAVETGGRLEVAGAFIAVTPSFNPPISLPTGTAKITYTSGSTGKPKGVCLSLDQMEAVAGSLVEAIGADYAGRHLPLLPLSILLENVAGLYATLIAGGRYHVLPAASVGLENPFRPDLVALSGAIAAEEATSLIVVPELLRALLMVMTFTGVRFPQLNLVAVGGAKVSPQLLSQADALGVPVYEGYGLSECASVVALNTPAARKAGAVGRPLSHLEVEIAADGEIVVGPQPFLGYAGDAPHHGPIRTGDLGGLDADGFLRIEGRRGSTIITAFGRNIAPEWVESELMAQPEIRQAVVFGEAQPELGALIVPLLPDMEEAEIGRAVARANETLPDYAQVKRWRIRPPFDLAAGELTHNGRPRRAVLLSHHRDFIEASQ
jgi:long-subunit acyl-CoA synthetase (AMP-forming)